MFLFRMIEFVFQILTAIFIVLLLQISIGGQSLESFFMSFVQNSKTTAPIRELAYSGAKWINPSGIEVPKNQETSFKPNLKKYQSVLPLVSTLKSALNQVELNVDAYEKTREITDKAIDQLEQNINKEKKSQKEIREENKQLLKEVIK